MIMRKITIFKHKGGYNSETIYFRIYVYRTFFSSFWILNLTSRSISSIFPDTLYNSVIFQMYYSCLFLLIHVIIISQISSHAIVWLMTNLALIWIIANPNLYQMQVNLMLGKFWMKLTLSHI